MESIIPNDGMKMDEIKHYLSRDQGGRDISFNVRVGGSNQN